MELRVFGRACPAIEPRRQVEIKKHVGLCFLSADPNSLAGAGSVAHSQSLKRVAKTTQNQDYDKVK